MNKNSEERQQVLISWDDMQCYLQQQQEAMLQANLLLVSAQLTCTMMGNRNQEDAVELFAHTHSMLQDWYRATPVKEEVRGIIENIIPPKPW